MKKPLPKWCQDVKIELIRRSWTMDDLSKAVGRSNSYVSAVVNARVNSPTSIAEISEVLGIEAPPGFSLVQV